MAFINAKTRDFTWAGKLVFPWPSFFHAFDSGQNLPLPAASYIPYNL
jgi:hypothetical protein